ncbi:MAG: stage V sporulation protein AD [Lachnospiraceae bacterium]|nr:stage V sporulation protein AD [Lachnospiraceae bacterium]
MELSKSKNKRKRCIKLSNPVYVENSAGVVGPKEGTSHFAEGFDKVCKDPFLGKDSWEEAESELQKEALDILLRKACITEEQIDCIFSGDLLSQSTASSYGLLSFGIPNYGIYGACSNCGATLALGAVLLSAGYAEKVVAMTSSHFGSAEKEFRFPLGYGAQRPLSSTWTVTGCGAFLLSRENTAGSKVCISHIVMGEIVDAGLKDPQNMGGCMAPAAALTIGSALKELPYSVDDYDQIITGDLGEIGSEALYDLLSLQGYDITKNHSDCGLLIFDREKEDVHAGGSGCGCSATMLSAYVLEKLKAGEWKRVLFVPTGALLSKLRSEEGMTIPAIAHGVVLEHC